MDLSNLYRKGMESFERKNYDYAIQVYSQILELEPDSADAFRYLRASSIRRSESGSRVGKTSMFFGSAKTKGLAIARQWSKLYPACVKTISTSPSDAANYMMLGDAAWNLNYMDVAIASYQAVTELDDSFDAYFNLAQIHKNIEDYPAAQECAERAHTFDPTHRELSKFMKDLSALSFQSKSNLVEAATSEQGDFRSSLKNADQAEGMEDDNRILRTKDEIENAICKAKKTFEEDTNNKKVAKKIADLYFKKKSYKESKEWHKKVVAIDIGESQSQDKIGDINVILYGQLLKQKTAIYRKEKTDAAKKEALIAKKKLMLYEIKEHERRVKEHPSDLRRKFELGEKYFTAKKIDEAVSMFQMAIKDPKIKIKSLHRLGQCFVVKGLFELAMGQFETAMADMALMNDGKKAVLYDLADCKEKADDKPGAKKLFAEIYQHDINFRDVTKRIEHL